MKRQNHPLRTRLMALLLVLNCVLGLLPTAAFAAEDTIRLTDFGMSGVAYQSAALGRCTLHQMYFNNGGKNVTGFCGTKGGGMGTSLKGQTWGNKTEISDPTVKTMMLIDIQAKLAAGKGAGYERWANGHVNYTNNFESAGRFRQKSRIICRRLE